MADTNPFWHDVFGPSLEEAPEELSGRADHADIGLHREGVIDMDPARCRLSSSSTQYVPLPQGKVKDKLSSPMLHWDRMVW